MSTHQHALGQHYSERAEDLLVGVSRPPKNAVVIEPFAGQGDLLKWLGPGYITVAYDVEPKAPNVLTRDTLANPPKYAGTYVLTNPPWLAKNKSEDKYLFEKWGTDDLYKCFMKSLMRDPPMGGIIIIPLNFLSGVRDSEKKRRQEFFTVFKPIRINIFEEAMFEDTDYLTLVIEFKHRITGRQKLEEQWEFNYYPSKITEQRTIKNGHFPGENAFETNYTQSPKKQIPIRRHEDTKPIDAKKEFLTHILLEALDSGVSTSPGNGRIGLRLLPQGETYVGKSTSRSKAQIVLNGVLSRKLQQRVVDDFNKWIEEWRTQTRSMFLPIFREAKDYPRRRIPFELAYEAIQRIIWSYYETPNA